MRRANTQLRMTLYRLLRSEEAEISVEDAARALGLHRGTLYRYTNGELPIPAGVVVDFTRLLGRPDLLQTMAEQCGYRVIPAGEVNVSSSYIKEILDMGDHFGRVAEELRRDLYDERTPGQVDPIEARRLHQKLEELENIVVNLRVTLAKRMG